MLGGDVAGSRCHLINCRWGHGQECQPNTDGEVEPTDGQDDGPKSTAANGYVSQYT